jgi:hypothetical protein
MPYVQIHRIDRQPEDHGPHSNIHRSQTVVRADVTFRRDEIDLMKHGASLHQLGGAAVEDELRQRGLTAAWLLMATGTVPGPAGSVVLQVMLTSGSPTAKQIANTEMISAFEAGQLKDAFLAATPDDYDWLAPSDFDLGDAAYASESDAPIAAKIRARRAECERAEPARSTPVPLRTTRAMSID